MKALFLILRLFRPVNLLIVLLTQAAAYFLLLKNPPELRYFLPTVLSTLLVAAAGYVINDYFDVKIDAVNRPKTLVLDVHLSRRWGLLLYGMLTALGIVLAALSFQWPILLMALFNAWLLWYYSYYLKRTVLWGNLSIAWLTGSVLLVLVPLDYASFYRLALFAVFAFYITLVREIIKDMQDVKGDKMFGCATFPIRYGYRNSKKLIFALTFLFAAFALPIAFHISTFLTLSLLVIGLLCFVMLYQLYFADTRHKLRMLSRFTKAIMVVGIACMAFTLF